MSMSVGSRYSRPRRLRSASREELSGLSSMATQCPRLCRSMVQESPSQSSHPSVWVRLWNWFAGTVQNCEMSSAATQSSQCPGGLIPLESLLHWSPCLMCWAQCRYSGLGTCQLGH